MNKEFAEYLYETFAPKVDFACSSFSEAFINEKLFEIMCNRLKGDTGPFNIRLKDGHFMDGKEVLDEDDYFMREFGVDGETAYTRGMSYGFSLFGELLVSDGRLYPGNELYSMSPEKKAEWVADTDPLKVAKCYLKFPDDAYNALPCLVDDIYSTVGSDPEMECGEYFFMLFKSEFLGGFLNAPIPDDKKKKAKELYDSFIDPLDWGYVWSDVNDGALYAAYAYGGLDGFNWVGLTHLNRNWLPCAVLLRDELDRLNDEYGFYAEERSMAA